MLHNAAGEIAGENTVSLTWVLHDVAACSGSSHVYALLHAKSAACLLICRNTATLCFCCCAKMFVSIEI